MKNTRTFLQNKGGAVIELALLLPFLLITIFGIIEFGILMFNKQVLTNAGREGARMGIVQRVPRATDGEIEAVVNNYCESHLITFGSAASPNTTITRSGLDFSDDLTVSVEYHYDFLVLPNFVGSLVGGTNLLAEVVMKME